MRRELDRGVHAGDPRILVAEALRHHEQRFGAVPVPEQPPASA